MKILRAIYAYLLAWIIAIILFPVCTISVAILLAALLEAELRERP